MQARTYAAALVALALAFFLGSCSGGGGNAVLLPGKPLPKPLAEQYPIDGKVDLSSFPDVQQRTIDLVNSLGTGTTAGTTTLRYAMANDERNLYIAMVWSDPTFTGFDPAAGILAGSFDGVTVMFDNDGDGVFEENEDARRLVMNRYSSGYGDIHSVPSGSSDADVIGDGMGKMTWSGGEYQAEFLIPLTPDAMGQDGVLNAKTRFNINIFDNIHLADLTGSIGSLSGPSGTNPGMDSSNWPLLPYSVPSAHDQPQMPNNLTGLIAFISDHENPAGELYTFDPATKAVSRVTFSTGMYMDGVSLSHDRTQLAFYGGPSTTDSSTWEIYTIPVSGGSMTKLTNNTILDGHPAWSPDDKTIVYASFRGPGLWQASLVTMTSATGREIANLSTATTTTANDNDPDWTPDGRIVFKTDRFNPSLPDQVRIAVMNADGTMVTQLTDSAGTSDHDPTATNTVAVFERFTKGTNYSTDPSAIYSPWNIVEARLDGSGERTLLADSWVNWLPVDDPTGRYMVYLKSVGYTDARLMDAKGRDLGRLIPGITQIRYIDWK